MGEVGGRENEFFFYRESNSKKIKKRGGGGGEGGRWMDRQTSPNQFAPFNQLL